MFNFLKSFFRSGENTSTKPKKFLDEIRTTDPELANAFNDWQDDFFKLMENTRKIYVKHGMDTTELDKLVSKYRGY